MCVGVYFSIVQLKCYFGMLDFSYPKLLAYSKSIHSLWERKLVRNSPRSERFTSNMCSGFLSASYGTRRRIRAITKIGVARF